MPRRHLTITPAFDTGAKIWFVDEFPGVEAESLRELLKKLPKGTKLTNYYPVGMSVPRPTWGYHAGDMVSAEHHIVTRKIVKHTGRWK